MHEVRKVSQVLVYELGVRPQFVKTLPTVLQGGQLALCLFPPLVELAQVRSQLLQGHEPLGLLALVGHAHALSFRQPVHPGFDLALGVAQGGELAL